MDKPTISLAIVNKNEMLWKLATGNLLVTNILTTTMTCKNTNILLQLNQHASCYYESIVFWNVQLCRKTQDY